MLKNLLLPSLVVGIISGCATTEVVPAAPVAATITVTATAVQLAAAAKLEISEAELTVLLNKQLYQMKPEETGRYISYLQLVEPKLSARIAHIGRKNIGQPYELYLLGEFPYETIDAQPLFSLEKSDCVVFAEHTYAMALGNSWEDFFWLLQRIRYRDGVIGVATRNHYTETDWNRENAWLVQDVTAQLAGTRAGNYSLTVDRQKFLKGRYKIDHTIAIEKTTETYVPKTMVAEIAAQLNEGDFVNVISGQNGNYWASHVGLVVLAPNGERNLLHSSEPVVREESFDSFIARATEREARQAASGKPGKVLAGFKFLGLRVNPTPPPMLPQPRPAKS